MKTFLFTMMFLVLLSSCGKAESGSNNQCNIQIIAGRDCIVCDRGGVSCDWR